MRLISLIVPQIYTAMVIRMMGVVASAVGLLLIRISDLITLIINTISGSCINPTCNSPQEPDISA